MKDEAIEQLCPNCGLCCDGTLFADVELRKGDDAAKLAKLGLVVENKGRVKKAFQQPCACFDGKHCGIYADRPKRCGAFECGLLKRVDAGEMETGAALKKISSAKRQIEKVNRHLALQGLADGGGRLMERYKAAMAAPIDFSKGAALSGKRGELMLEMDGLMQMLQKDFLG